MDVLAVINDKGGVGKTTISYHLAHLFAKIRKRVLAVDLDSQGHLSLAFGLIGVKGTELLFEGKPPQICAVGEFLGLIPTSRDVMEVDHTPPDAGLWRTLRNSLAEAAADIVILDCPPHPGNLFFNALIAARWLIVPVNASVLSVKAIDDLAGWIDTTKQEGFNPDLDIMGYVLNGTVPRGNSQRSAIELIEQRAGDRLFPTRIPQSVKVEESLQNQRPVFDLFPEHPASQAFFSLGQEIERRLNEWGNHEHTATRKQTERLATTQGTESLQSTQP